MGRVLAGHSKSPTANMSSSTNSVFDAAAAQLVAVHNQLRSSLSNVVRHAADERTADESLAEYATLVSHFLLAHHHVEDRRLFPALRQHGQQVGDIAASLARRRSYRVRTTSEKAWQQRLAALTGLDVSHCPRCSAPLRCTPSFSACSVAANR